MENKVPLDIERTLAENTERSLAEDTELSLDEDTQPSLERENERLRQRVSQLELELLAAQPDEQRALLSAVIETSVVAICLLDTDGKIVFANAAAESILDLERSLIVQRRYDDPEWRRTALDGSLWSDDQHPFARVMATGEPVRDVRFALEWPSGQRKFVSVDGAPIRDAEGSITSVVCCVSNITEEVRNTERMRARREWLRLALSSARMGIWSWDVVRDDVRWSDEVSVLFGLEPGEFAGTYEAYLRCVHPEDRECVRDSVAAVREPDAVTYFVEHRVVWPSGDVRWIEGRGRFIRDEDGSILTVTGTVADISARKEAEQALRASQDQLRQAQRLESIGRLAGGAAHDFNNLLTVVHGCAELIAATVDDHPNCRELTNSIVAAAEQGSALTQQLLAFAREQSIEPRVVDINDQIRKSSTLLRRLIGVGVELRMCLASRAISVEIDPRQFDQVLINLVVNACDAMNGIGVLSISTHSEPSRSSNVERAVITVDDSGTGIDPEVLPFLFEPFFTTKAPGEGTGLGLSTCFGIVAQAGGSIGVTSDLGRGSSFRVELPVVTELGIRDDAPRETHTLVKGGGTILLVDDNHMVRRVTRAILERAGYEVLDASDAASASDQYEQYRDRIDVLVTDIAMPKTNGRDLVRSLRAQDPELRVLFVSGAASEVTDLRAQPSERVRVLPKPFSVAELTEKVAELRGIR